MCYNWGMKRWALYARTSTSRQEKGLEAQVRALRTFADQKGITEFDVFSDEGVSGAKASRPGLDQAMDAIRQGKYEGIVVYSFSRFARSTKHLLEALDEFQNLNVGFISLSESIDTKSAIGKALFTLTGQSIPATLLPSKDSCSFTIDITIDPSYCGPTRLELSYDFAS